MAAFKKALKLPVKKAIRNVRSIVSISKSDTVEFSARNDIIIIRRLNPLFLLKYTSAL